MRRNGSRFGRRGNSAVTRSAPVSIGAAAWWDPSFGYTLNSTTVSAHVDRIGGYTVAQATGAQQPTWGATGFTYTRASNQRLTGAGALADLMDVTAAYTILVNFAVVAPVNLDTRALICGNTVASTTNAWYYGCICGAVDTNDRYFRAGSALTGTGVTGLIRRCLSIVYNGTTTSQWLNGVNTINASGSGGGTVGTLDDMTIGAIKFSGAYNHHWNGTIGDIVVFTSALSATNRQAMETWMMARP